MKLSCTVLNERKKRGILFSTLTLLLQSLLFFLLFRKYSASFTRILKKQRKYFRNQCSLNYHVYHTYLVVTLNYYSRKSKIDSDLRVFREHYLVG